MGLNKYLIQREKKSQFLAGNTNRSIKNIGGLKRKHMALNLNVIVVIFAF